MFGNVVYLIQYNSKTNDCIRAEINNGGEVFESSVMGKWIHLLHTLKREDKEASAVASGFVGINSAQLKISSRF